MAEAAVLFVDSFKVMMKEIESMRTRAASVETMLEGNAIRLCERWGASAVLLKNGEIAVVEEAARAPVDIPRLFGAHSGRIGGATDYRDWAGAERGKRVLTVFGR